MPDEGGAGPVDDVTPAVGSARGPGPRARWVALGRGLRRDTVGAGAVDDADVGEESRSSSVALLSLSEKKLRLEDEKGSSCKAAPMAAREAYSLYVERAAPRAPTRRWALTSLSLHALGVEAPEQVIDSHASPIMVQCRSAASTRHPGARIRSPICRRLGRRDRVLVAVTRSVGHSRGRVRNVGCRTRYARSAKRGRRALARRGSRHRVPDAPGHRRRGADRAAQAVRQIGERIRGPGDGAGRAADPGP